MEQNSSVPRSGIWYTTRVPPSVYESDSSSGLDTDIGSHTTDEVDWQAIGARGLLSLNTPLARPSSTPTESFSPLTPSDSVQPGPFTPEILPPSQDFVLINGLSDLSVDFNDRLVDINEDGNKVENYVDDEEVDFDFDDLDDDDDGDISEGEEYVSDCEEDDEDEEEYLEYALEEEEAENGEAVDDIDEEPAPKRERAKTPAEKAKRLAERNAATAERRRIKREGLDKKKKEREEARIARRLNDIEKLNVDLAQRKKEKKELIARAVSAEIKNQHDKITMRLRNKLATRQQTQEQYAIRNYRQNARKAAEKLGIELLDITDYEKTPAQKAEDKRLIGNMSSRERQREYRRQRLATIEENAQIYPVAMPRPTTLTPGTDTSKPLSILTICRFSNRQDDEGFVQEHAQRNQVVTAKFVRDFVAPYPVSHNRNVVWNGRVAWKGLPWADILDEDEVNFPDGAGGRQNEEMIADEIFLRFMNTRPENSTVLIIIRGIDGASISPETWVYLCLRYPRLNITLIFACQEVFVRHRTDATQKYFWHRTLPWDGKLYAFFSLKTLADHLQRVSVDPKCTWLENEWRVGVLTRKAISAARVGRDVDEIREAHRQFALLHTSGRNNLPII